MESQRNIVISFKQNPAAAEALQGKSLGEECKMSLVGTVKEINAEGAVLNIEALIPEGYEVDEEAEGDLPAAPMGAGLVGAAEETIPTATAAMVTKKA